MNAQETKDYIERHQREVEQEEKGFEFADLFSQLVNSSSRKTRDAAIGKMLRDHRTLQQGMMRFVMDYIEGMAEKQHFDLRNEASVKLAKAIMELPSDIRSLPLI
jgi:dGTP triphosphohydrolase